MRWLLLAPPEIAGPGPARSWTGLLGKALFEAGETVGIAGRPRTWAAWCRETGVELFPFRLPARVAPWAVARLAGPFARSRPDAVLVPGLAAARMARLADRRTAIALRPGAPEALRGTVAERLAFRYGIDRVFADHHAARRRYLRHPWIHEGAVVTVHHGIAIDGPVPDPARRARARARLGLTDDRTPAAAWMGHLVAGSRPMQALLAFEQAAASCPGARFFLLGDGPQRRVLERHVEEQGLAGCVRLLGWREDARELLRGMDLLAHTGFGPNLPHAVLEAMAAGCAVVAARASGLPEVVRDGVDGYLVAPGDTPAMAARLAALALDPAARGLLGAAAAARARGHFSSAAMAARVRAAMAEVAEDRRLLHARGIPIGGGWRGIAASTSLPALDLLRGQTRPETVPVAGPARVTRYEEPSAPRFRGGRRVPHAVRNLRMAARLSLLGIRVVAHRAAAWRQDGERCRSLLYRESASGLAPLETWLNEARHGPPTRAAFCESTGRWLAGLHAAGVVPYDLRSQRLFVAEEEGDSPALVLGDLDHSRMRWRVRHDDMLSNLADFYRSLRVYATRREMLYFAAAYRRVRGMRRARLRQLLGQLEAAGPDPVGPDAFRDG